MGLEDEVVQLTRRVAELEGRLAGLEQATQQPAPPLGGYQTSPGFAPPPAGRPSTPYQYPPQDLQQPQNQPQYRPAHQPPPAPSQPRGSINSGIDSEAVLKWAGLGLVVLAAIFLVGTAINRGWIGPELQLLGATLAGLGLIGGAFRLVDSNRPWAVTLASGGAIVLPICAAAGNAGLGLWPNGPGMVVLGLTTIGLCAAAQRLRMEPVAALAAVGALILWTWIGEDPSLSVFVVAGWLGAVTVGFTAFTLLKDWTATRLLTVGLAMPLILGVALVEGGDNLAAGPQAVALALLGVVAIAVWLAPAIRLRLTTAPIGWLEALEHRSILLLPIWAWGSVAAILGVDDSTELSWLAFGGIALFALAALAGGTSGLLTRRLLLSHGLGIGILLTVALVLAVSDGSGLLAALAAQAAATAVLAWRFDDRLLQLQAGVLGVVSLVWATGLMFEGLFEPLDAGHHLVNGFVVALLGAAAYAVDRFGHGSTTGGSTTAGPSTDGSRSWSRLLAVGAWILALLWIAAVFAHAPQGQVIISVLWAIAAASAIVIGIRIGDGLVRTVGLTTLGVVVIKLLSVDLASVDTLWRVGLFFVIGAGLLRLGYVLPRLSGAPAGPPPQGPQPAGPPPQGPPPSAAPPTAPPGGPTQPLPQFPPPTTPARQVASAPQAPGSGPPEQGSI